MVTQSRVKQLLSYDPDSGEFINIAPRPRIRVGDFAGTTNALGYRVIALDTRQYFAHRLAWLYIFGEFPTLDIDHINGIRDDNRITNLRLATRKQNLENMGLSKRNTSGYRGVTWDKHAKKWAAQVTHYYKKINCGRYDTPHEAALAALKARNRLFSHHLTPYAA